MLVLITSSVLASRIRVSFSRMRSKITMVSLSEYPTMVSIAAMVAVLISSCSAPSTPSMIAISWIKASRAPTAKAARNRNRMYTKISANATVISHTACSPSTREKLGPTKSVCWTVMWSAPNAAASNSKIRASVAC